MNRLLAVGVGLALLLFSGAAIAAKGVVVLRKSGCSYYVVETTMGFAILEWYGGNNPSKGETLVGDFESYGMRDIYNFSSEAETKIWVEDYWLSKTRMIEKFYGKCD